MIDMYKDMTPCYKSFAALILHVLLLLLLLLLFLHPIECMVCWTSVQYAYTPC